MVVAVGIVLLDDVVVQLLVALLRFQFSLVLTRTLFLFGLGPPVLEPIL